MNSFNQIFLLFFFQLDNTIKRCVITPDEDQSQRSLKVIPNDNFTFDFVAGELSRQSAIFDKVGKIIIN